MLLLATDTSGKYGSIALAQCGPEDQCTVLQVVPLTGGTFSAQLVPQIAALLQQHGFTKQDIDAFAVASGPGSFTGLRVGLAAIKALADVLQRPIAAVSLLEVISSRANVQGKIFAALDAGRNEAFLGGYELRPSGMVNLGEQLVTLDELAKLTRTGTLLTPDQKIADTAATGGIEVRMVDRPQSDAIARLGWLKIRVGETVSPEDLEANYIRRSDAEIFSKIGSR